ncbi:islet cell autoantigen 1, isoform CRA_b [Rattus norvegicus]|uniref:Islet cell autoantigen 1, isoform CRA_b n=2 Tax=Rattus norvegicus TaxID=10116 RepID=A0A0G2K9Z2_RAT|nr:islet cell autoantigen 1 [Rattus norvegicus]XP_006236154.1 islet cell autoantigen 1 isoform X1 [Rattus norvegicus]XP_006236155.1 islet cell autoantigen 1 isoform X1 [Rattus norvegicus]XP_006236156.1 islet cell autoantigen 1 isoform X1 [Rattus norvegicus]XP_006236157.1 islet cell autoantigen 1 isoform X1 [Rattus norvegicus]AAH78812.1 Ica1 protein [Rattus norvegicus]EDM15066.1 islet cell autoantigen 1, isoform CRA_b [Rattus norvegicus]EDM15067.1 islet cell autoantigen 1, isoform CRA_b [Ratt|eukprot:NP_110471.2 islet cell autoantigen 1 [Rattus norvegicus]
MSGHKCYSWELQDRFAQDKSVVNKMQQKYWETKQAFIKATGKKEDEHVVASDADLDAKLELFHSIQRTCLDLSKAIVLYQKRICFLSQEENELGKFLRSQGFQDKTRAGKMMQATGKALCFSSQQRLALRNPLCRFHQEVETFRHRAISDTWLTVNRMEQCRTEYRGALLWMKDVSQELDPDLYKQMEKFRKVQTQVRLAKKNFDKLKMDVCQKVDLLGASRCNLLSHMLATYQTTLLHFWEKTSHTMAAIHESFKGYQPYEFTTLKSLQDPMKKLVEKEKKKSSRRENREAVAQEPRQLISLEEENQHKESSTCQTEEGKSVPSSVDKSSADDACSGPIDELLDVKPEEACLGPMAGTPEPESGDKDDLLLLNEIFSTSSLDEGEFSREWAAVFGDDRLKEPAPMGAQGEPDPKPQIGSAFLPSQLLDQNMKDLQASLQEPAKAASDLTAWFSLFADLDPLSNPDAIGKTDKEHELLNA